MVGAVMREILVWVGESGVWQNSSLPMISVSEGL